MPRFGSPLDAKIGQSPDEAFGEPTEQTGPTWNSENWLVGLGPEHQSGGRRCVASPCVRVVSGIGAG